MLVEPPPHPYKTGVVLTTHGRGNYGYVRAALDSVLRYGRPPQLVLVYDNEGEDARTADIPHAYPFPPPFPAPSSPPRSDGQGAEGTTGTKGATGAEELAEFAAQGGNEVRYYHVRNQSRFGGLTGTWNAGIREALREGCEVVVLLNHDVVVDASWRHLTDSAAASHDRLLRPPSRSYRPGPHGPITNQPSFERVQFGSGAAPVWGWQEGRGSNRHGSGRGSRGESGGGSGSGSGGAARGEEETGARSDVSVESFSVVGGSQFVLNGFVWAVHRDTFELNRFDERHFFDPQYPFGFNERDWLRRWYRLGRGAHEAHVVRSAFVLHHCLSSWRAFDEK